MSFWKVLPSLQHSGLNNRVARWKPLHSKKGTWQPAWSLPKRHLKTLRPWETKILWHECQASHLEETWHHTYGEEWWWQHHAMRMFFKGRERETSQDRGKDERSKVQRSLMKICSRALRTSDWGEGSPSNRAMTLSTHLRHRRSGFGTSLWMSLSDPARARTWTQSNISGETWK